VGGLEFSDDADRDVRKKGREGGGVLRSERRYLLSQRDHGIDARRAARGPP
jgi:hypothetical protein